MAQSQVYYRRLSRSRSWRSQGWRSWVLWSVLLALAWPSLGALPWIEPVDLADGHLVAHHAGHSDQTSSAEHHHGIDASDIPGSPTHPADHDCFQCQVLKHLSRSAPAQFDPPAISPLCGSPVQPTARVTPQRDGHVAFLPPVRAPPLLSA